MQMIHQLAIRLRDLHGLGYVHRDLKPSNVMWLPRENRWTLIDFGCAARIGESAKQGFSIAYAAPEVISTYRRGDKALIAEVRTHVVRVVARCLAASCNSTSMQPTWQLQLSDSVCDNLSPHWPAGVGM